MNNDLISRSELIKAFEKVYPLATNEMGGVVNKQIYDIIDNAPTVKVPENEVNCVLTMFGKCSYNETGCSDCEIKDKIRKALKERPQGEWKPKSVTFGTCFLQGFECDCGRIVMQRENFCPNCGAEMVGGES